MKISSVACGFRLLLKSIILITKNVYEQKGLSYRDILLKT